jgi:AhpD family alkylhydroperoxidase
MAPYAAFRKGVYKDGALDAKTKRLIALAAGFMASCTRCIIGQTKDAVQAGATKAEIMETVAVAVVMGGTSVSAESWRVVKALEELGKW